MAGDERDFAKTAIINYLMHKPLPSREGDGGRGLRRGGNKKKEAKVPRQFSIIYL
jgi:hypothetical protein